MKKELVTGDGMEHNSSSSDHSGDEHVGMKGFTTTVLRPAGKADINGESIDVTAIQGFIDEGKKIVVVSEDGVRILVEEIT